MFFRSGCIGSFLPSFRKVIVSVTFKPLVHRYLRGSGWMKEMNRAQHNKEIISYINN